MLATLTNLRRRSSDDGFTLIELLVVVIIIGVLAAIALPIFLNQQKAAVDASVKSDVRNTVSEVQGWVANHSGVAASDTATYTSASNGGKIAASGSNAVGVVVNADGSFTVCAYASNGGQFTDATKAWGFDSTTGHFSATSTCSGTPDDPTKTSSVVLSTNNLSSGYGLAASSASTNTYGMQLTGFGDFAGWTNQSTLKAKTSDATLPGVTATCDLHSTANPYATATRVSYNVSNVQLFDASGNSISYTTDSAFTPKFSYYVNCGQLDSNNQVTTDPGASLGFTYYAQVPSDYTVGNPIVSNLRTTVKTVKFTYGGTSHTFTTNN